jgi:hypothetical protein
VQHKILRDMMLVGVGNAFLSGRDVRGFWPDAGVFVFSETCEFLVPERFNADAYRQIAPDPLAWLGYLRARGVKGLRLHNAPAELGPEQRLNVQERMMVGFVGGGPRWLIEAVSGAKADLWEGFDRLGDRNHPERRIWKSAYLLQGETAPQDAVAFSLTASIAEIDAILVKIEKLAIDMGAGNFADCFSGARAALAGVPDRVEGMAADAQTYAAFTPDMLRLFEAANTAWVFGGMGSWNDLVAPDHLEARYEQLSEELFRALTDAVCVLANATYKPS